MPASLDPKWCPFCGSRQSEEPIKPVLGLIEVDSDLSIWRCFYCGVTFRVYARDNDIMAARRRRSA